MDKKSIPWTLAGITVSAVVLATALGMNAQRKDETMEYPVSYQAVRVDGLSIFYRPWSVSS